MQTSNLPLPRRKRRKRRVRFWIMTAILLIIGAMALTYAYQQKYGPVYTRIVPDYGVDKPVFYQGKQLEGSAAGEGETLKLPFPLVKEVIDPNIWHEEATDSIIITTEQQVVRMVTDQLTAWVNDQPVELRFPVEQIDEVLYVPMEPLKQFYGISLEEKPGTNIVVLYKPGDILNRAKVPEPAEEEKPQSVYIRQEPSIRSPIVAELAPGETADIWGEVDGWYLVQHPDGTAGYAEKNDLVWEGSTVYEPSFEREKAPYVPDRPMGEKINLTWEQVYSANPNPERFDPMPGLNVVSPTWFHILDGEGALENRASPAYVQWAHDNGIQVWALFSNSFDPDLTSEALSTYDRRMNMARQLLSWAQLYKLDGINIDFENMHLKDGPLLTQFIRELAPLLHEAGLTLSVDVTFISTSENWSLFYDRKALGEVVDYMMVMAYDEHWASSPVAGSVASLPWVEQGVKRIIQEAEVPPEKIVLGIPFYTRVWTEEVVDGKTKVSSKAVGMDTVKKLIEEKQLTPVFDEAAGQNYVEYKENGAVKKIWIEDETSVRARIEIVHRLELAGIASWSRNFASAEIWEIIDQSL